MQISEGTYIGIFTWCIDRQDEQVENILWILSVGTDHVYVLRDSNIGCVGYPHWYGSNVCRFDIFPLLQLYKGLQSFDT